MIKKSFIKRTLLPFSYSIFILSISLLALATANLLYESTQSPSLEMYCGHYIEGSA